MRNSGGDLRERTRAFALAVLRLSSDLPRNRAADVIGKQLLRSGTSVAANYRSACRARSRREFVAKMGVVEEEADETAFWLELLRDGGVIEEARVSALHSEANQLVAITVSSIRTARGTGRAIPHSAFRIPHSEGR